MTLHEALKANDELKKEGIFISVIDLYSIKPREVRDFEEISKDVMTNKVKENI